MSDYYRIATYIFLLNVCDGVRINTVSWPKHAFMAVYEIELTKLGLWPVFGFLKQSIILSWLFT